MFHDSTRDLLGFQAITLYEQCNLPSNSVDVLSFDNKFSECDIAQGMIFRGKRIRIIHKFTLDFDPA